jgi:hypothetical protein
MLQKQPGLDAVPTAGDVKITPEIILGLTEIESIVRNEHDNKGVHEVQRINLL